MTRVLGPCPSSSFVFVEMHPHDNKCDKIIMNYNFNILYLLGSFTSWMSCSSHLSTNLHCPFHYWMFYFCPRVILQNLNTIYSRDTFTPIKHIYMFRYHFSCPFSLLHFSWILQNLHLHLYIYREKTDSDGTKSEIVEIIKLVPITTHSCTTLLGHWS